MDFKLIGSILLIIGTSIGAGMLALPIATAQLGFLGSVVLLIICWFIMTAGALLLLEVNLWLPQNTNLISMTKATIGPLGQLVAWLAFLLLLYSLECAYIAGGGDLLHDLFVDHDMAIPRWTASCLFTVLLGAVVYFGIRSVDYVNRGLMIIKCSAYLLLVLLLTPFIKPAHLLLGEAGQLTSTTAIMVTITAFGYAAIVPSLRVYFQGDIKKLKTAILVGSTIPLFCYIAWDAAIMGVLPFDSSITQTSQLLDNINQVASTSSVTFFAKLFTSVCMVTSFLGVALCLADFLADGLQQEKKGMANVLVHILTLLPPLAIVLFFPNVFVKALEYAGIYCVILLVLLPALMAWWGRYRKHLAKGYVVKGGKPLLLLLIVFSFIMLAKSTIFTFFLM